MAATVTTDAAGGDALRAALATIDTWPVEHAAAAVRVGDTFATHGDTQRPFRLASLTKPIAAWAMLVAVEEGVISLDTPVGQPGCTLRHLLAHAGGYGFDGVEPVSAPERTRIYSNTGIELAAAAVAAATGFSFPEYLHEAVLTPLGMTASELRGSAAHALHSTVDDVTAFLAEVRTPTLITPETATQMQEVHFADLSGIVPGVGRFDPSPWGLGFEIRGGKTPHWTSARNSPATVGHFGGAGTMMWFDRPIDTALVALTDRPFDQWATEALRVWPALSDAVIDVSATTGTTTSDPVGGTDAHGPARGAVS